MDDKEKDRLLELVEILEYEAKTYREVLDVDGGSTNLKDCVGWIGEKLEDFKEEYNL